MKKLLIVISFTLIAGCSVSKERYEKCATLCAKNGGVDSVLPSIDTDVCFCENGGRFNLK